jgi:hypothetical protein
LLALPPKDLLDEDSSHGTERVGSRSEKVRTSPRKVCRYSATT